MLSAKMREHGTQDKCLDLVNAKSYYASGWDFEAVFEIGFSSRRANATGQRYERVTMFKVIKQGQQVAVWDRTGQVKLVDGPRIVWKFGKSIQDLKQYRAHANEYLRVEYQDGHCEHLRGPVSIWFHPVNHHSISICSALELDANEAIVVYENQDGKVSRQIVRGPSLFVPTENQWLHQFRWHGSKGQKFGFKVPRSLEFQKLRVIPDQMYFHVVDVRTADDAVLTIKLMIFFELVFIDEMLKQTHDPIADFINAVTADTIDFAAARTFEEFKRDTESLNQLDSYKNLTSRAQRIGYEINKVVYRGYVASAALQTMHDGAIEARTQLKLESETEAQAQELADMRLAREAERTKQRNNVERQQAQHQRELERLRVEEELRQATAREQLERESVQQNNLVELEHLRAINQEKSAFLESVADMQVDMTRYLVAQYQNPDRIFRVQGDSETQLHLHETS